MTVDGPPDEPLPPEPPPIAEPNQGVSYGDPNKRQVKSRKEEFRQKQRGRQRDAKQAVEERFTMRTADWLLAVLRRGVQFLVCAQAVSIPLLKRFSAVLVEDGSTISLPSGLKQVWRGCGGSGPAAALKLTVRWDLLRGGLSGPYVQEGRRHETQSPLREQQMPRGSLWIGDLGYFALTWLTQLVKQGVVKRRREQLKEQAHKQCKPINSRQWELVQWTIVLTNVPVSLLAAAEAMALLRARWQIELLWK